MASNHRKARILLVEDDHSILRGLELNLGVEGYEVGTAAEGKTGLKRAMEESWDLIVLDIMMPGPDGLEILRRVRAARKETGVILLSARGAEFDKVVGLDLGADDYLTKPFGLAELLARIKAVLRRRSQAPAPTGEPISQFGDVQVDRERRRVTKAGREVALTAREYEVLEYFLTREDRVVTREDLLEKVWGFANLESNRTVDNFVSQLRAKLEANADQPVHFLTVRGVGYRFVARPETR
ncbi:MAG: response regulator transcription factor [bacterium]